MSVHDLGVDFATGGSVKWLCGGPGAGYLYVRRDLWPRLEPRPRQTGRLIELSEEAGFRINSQ